MAELLEYKCPCCGGKIEFDSTAQKMKCPYCDTEFDVETLRGYDDILKEQKPDDLSAASDPANEWRDGEADGLKIYSCKSCGGEIVADETTAATHCPYCGNPVVMTGQLSGELRPDLVIPFKLDKKAAKAAFSQHLTGKRLLPKVFRDQNHIDEIKGIYVPFWLYDATADADIQYRGTRMRTWSDRDFIYTETSHYSITRGGSLAFKSVPADGSSKMPDELMESLEPFNLSEAVDFQTAYLSGYFADRYDVDSEQQRSRAKARMKASTENAFRSTVNGYSTTTVESSSVRLNSGKARYALFPVWILNTKWNGKKFIFAMNGQTGKFVGDLPLDKNAYAAWFAGLTAAVGAAAYLLMWLILSL